MRISFLWCLGFGSSVFASDNHDESIDLVKKAIEAHGGRENLTKMQVFHVVAKNSLVGPDGKDVIFNSEYWFQQPYCQRYVTEIEAKGKKIKIMLINNENAGWIKIDGGVQEMSTEQLISAKEKCYAWRIRTLLPLLEAGPPALKFLGDTKVEGLMTLGIRVISKDHWDLDLFFSKESSLLTAMSSQEIGADGKTTNVLTIFSEYKNLEGLKYPSKMVGLVGVNRAKTIQELIRFTPFSKLDSHLFDAPKRGAKIGDD